MKLSINIDHVATVRNARGEGLPRLLDAAAAVVQAGADLITVHLREDQRHINSADIADLFAWRGTPLNIEIAARPEMVTLIAGYRPESVCLVPENRREITTEGGLNLFDNTAMIAKAIKQLQASGCKVSLFIEPDKSIIDAAVKLGADTVELHTGAFSRMQGENYRQELLKITAAAQHAHNAGLICHAGHGLRYQHARDLAAIATITTLHIGHFIIAEAIFVGLVPAITKMKASINVGRSRLVEA